jgi:uncharacterized membrane protein YjjP (DUF1212 family)/uncharacterized membrane protein YjjB (DUF3815 family)
MASDKESAPPGVPSRGAADVGAVAGGDHEAVVFLADLAAALHVAYLPSDLVEWRVEEAARGLGVDAEVFALYSAVVLQRRGRGGAHLVRASSSPTYNLARLHHLVTLSERVADGRLPFPAARDELAAILAAPRRYPRPAVVLGFAVYGAAVAARVGGGAAEVLAAGLIGVVAGAIQYGIHAGPLLTLQKGFVAALVGTLSAYALALVLPPFDPGRAVLGSMALLVPAMTLTVAAHELASDAAVESGVVRLVYATTRFVMIGAGAFAARGLWTVLGPATPGAEPVALPALAVAVAVAVGGLALAVCLQARPADVLPIVAAVLFAWGVSSATKAAVGGQGGPFVAAFAAAVAGGLYARLPGRVAGTVIFPAVLQLVPTFLGTQTVLSSLRPGAPAAGATTFVDVLLVAVQLALGLLVGAFVARPRPSAGAGG